jgi:hypothetical protein
LTVPAHRTTSRSAQIVSCLPDDLDAFRPTVLDDDACRDCLRQQVEIAAPPSRLREGHRGASAAAVADIGVDAAKTLHDIGVEVVDDRIPRLASGGEEGVADRQIEPRLLDCHRTVVAVPLTGAAAVRLRSFEVRQHFVKRPSLAATLCPLVVFERMATQVEHAVDAARAAENAPLKSR